MKTDFFTSIAELGTTQVHISISFCHSDDRMTVSIIPSTEKKDIALRELQPLSVTATPQELDEQFFTIALEPIKQTISLIDNTNRYIEQKAVTEKNVQAEKDKKDKTSKLTKEITSLLANKETIKDNESKIKKLIADLRAIDSQSKEATNFYTELLRETETTSLF